MTTPVSRGRVPRQAASLRSRPWVGDYDGLVQPVAGRRVRETHQVPLYTNEEPLGAFHAPYNSPGPFSILGPQGTVNDPTPQITWEESAGATGYHVVVSTVPDLSEVVWESHPGAGVTSATVTVLLDDGTYYTGVTAQASGDQTEAVNHGLAFTVEGTLPQMHLMFATANLNNVTGDPSVPPPSLSAFGSLEAADWLVTYAATFAQLIPDWNGMDLIYRAVLSIDGTDARDRIAVAGPIYNTQGELLVTDHADLWDGSLAHPVGYDEYANPIAGNTDAWTGTSYIGNWILNQSCGAWNIPASSYDGGQEAQRVQRTLGLPSPSRAATRRPAFTA